jgi:N-acetylmuramoyl-L-alanine amidase
MFGKAKSPNYGVRERGAKPSLIILHYTGMQTAQEALKRLCDKVAQVSSHYFIDEDGETIQLVSDKKRAWHAGQSSWRGEADINSHSIGIELVNPGHEFGYREFPPPQIEALRVLCQKLMKKHKILPADVLGHSDVAPMRKTDPGELFPWQALATEGIGIWPQPLGPDREEAQEIYRDIIKLHEKLITYGYDSAAGYAETLAAFHRHFYPEKFRKGENPVEADLETATRLIALTRQRQSFLEMLAQAS